MPPSPSKSANLLEFHLTKRDNIQLLRKDLFAAPAPGNHSTVLACSDLNTIILQSRHNTATRR